MISVLLADDHDLVRAGIRSLLEGTGEVEVVAECATGEDAIRLARQFNPQIVFMDIQMPGIGGIEATRKLQRFLPEAKVIVLTMYDGEPYPNQVLNAGAAGYITKGSSADEMLAAMRMVMRGKRYIANEIAQKMALNTVGGKERGENPFEQLSAREMQVMLMVVNGQGIQEISDALNLSPKTVSTYRYRLFEKLGVKNDVELTRLAVRYRVIGVDSD
ncbi:MAG: UvrY/SirA/GacA family response regulator transcription factor [Chromatiales bacterium]|nr:UvrY/SirA/GacA family response regulator transcription factor [Chromatiales bacterium]